MTKKQEAFRRNLGVSLILLLGFILVFGVVGIRRAGAQEAPGAAMSQLSTEQAEVLKFELIAAAIAFGFGAIGAGIAIANVGAAAMGAIGERPEIASQALIFIALAEGLVVFGFITALMILGKL